MNNIKIIDIKKFTNLQACNNKLQKYQKLFLKITKLQIFLVKNSVTPAILGVSTYHTSRT